MQEKPKLKVDWATHEAAKHSCVNWHYSKCLPAGKLVKIGAWENSKFIGVVIFSRGANYNASKEYGLTQVECVELTRIALRGHVSPVSRICSIAVKYFQKANPGVRLLVSYADPRQGHHGGIYQASNWTYVGRSAKSNQYYYKGKWVHNRTIDSAGLNKSALPKRVSEGKHRYLMPLDDDMKEQISKLSKPYPKRSKQAMAGTTSTAAGQHRPERSKGET